MRSMHVEDKQAIFALLSLLRIWIKYTFKPFESECIIGPALVTDSDVISSLQFIHPGLPLSHCFKDDESRKKCSICRDTSKKRHPFPAPILTHVCIGVCLRNHYFLLACLAYCKTLLVHILYVSFFNVVLLHCVRKELKPMIDCFVIDCIDALFI